MTSVKKRFSVDLGVKAAGALEAFDTLNNLLDGSSFHPAQDARHPAGTYNRSVQRILGRLCKLCEAAERCFKGGINVESADLSNAMRNEMLERLELVLYAAAEHVDDIKLILKCFFRNTESKHSKKQIEVFLASLKTRRDRISSIVNSIKHSQARLCLYYIDATQSGSHFKLLGFFVEVFSNGAARPSPNIHKHGEQIISITSIIWEILIFVLDFSHALAGFLRISQAVNSLQSKPIDNPILEKAIVAAARLPLYSFDEVHPFETVTMKISASGAERPFLRSDLYGSIGNPWISVGAMDFGNQFMMFEGDGTKTPVHIATPKHVNLQHWT